MSNLAQTQSAWTQLFREIGFFLAVDKYLDDANRKFDSQRNRVQIVEQNSVNAFTSAWTLAGPVFGTNTDETGTLYVRIAKDAFATTVAVASNGVNVNAFAGAQTLNVANTTGFPAAGSLSVTTGSGVFVVTYTGGGGGGTTFTGCTVAVGGAGVLATGGAVTASTVSLYTAVGASGLVAAATGGYPASGTNTLTLAAQNASGLTGTVALTTLTASESDDKHRLLVLPDFMVRARAVFNGTDPTHAAILGAFITACGRIQAQITAGQNQLAAVLSQHLTSRVANFTGSSQSAAIVPATTGSNGTITTTFTGILEDLRKDMVDELTAGAQSVLQSTVAAAAPVADANNVGKGALSTPTMAQWANSGTVTLVCTDATIGAEKFAVSQRLAITNQTIPAANPLQVKKAFADPNIGITTMTLSRTLAFIAGGASTDFGAAGGWTINNESPTNTTGGTLYLTVTGSTGAWVINGYLDVALTQMVFYTAPGAASASLPIVGINAGSALTGTAVVGSAPVTGHTATLSLQTFVTQGTGTPAPPDKFTIAVTQSTFGQFQDRIAELFSYQLNSVASSPTINDGLASAGSFPPYTVLDA